jgi:hypothetical protein
MGPTRPAAHGCSHVAALIEAELDLGALGAPSTILEENCIF